MVRQIDMPVSKGTSNAQSRFGIAVNPISLLAFQFGPDTWSIVDTENRSYASFGSRDPEKRSITGADLIFMLCDRPC